MKLISFLPILGALSAPTEKPAPPPFRAVCEDFCASNDCSNRGSKNNDIFIPFGSVAGDIMGQRRDDTAEGPITLSNPVPYFGNTYNNLYFSSNGAISFESGITAYTSSPFPIADNAMFSPFWADFNTAVAGNWSYRALSSNDLTTVSSIVNYELDSNFAGRDGVVVTYDRVAFYGRSLTSDRTNNMQAILVHDNNHSYAIFQYGDIEWTTGTASQGDRCTGLGGTPAQVGFNDGQGNYYSVPGSQTDYMQNIDDMTNCKSIGRFIFKVDGVTVETPAPSTVAPSVEISIAEPLTGIADCITEHFSSSRNIFTHGCHCSKLGGATGLGSPVDGLDRICSNWIRMRNCILKNGGACQTGSGVYTSFTPSNCGGDGCEDLVCNIDEKFRQEVQSFIDADPSWEPVTDAICTSQPNFTVKESCCGLSAETLVAYNSETQTCVDGQLI